MHMSDWVETHTRRILNLCRVVSQALMPSKKTPEWAKRLPWFDKELPSSSAASTAEAAEYFYGFDKEMKQGWRTLCTDTKKKTKDYSAKLEDPAGTGMADTDPVVAVWADGHRKALAQLTVGDYKLMLLGRRAADPNVWTGEHEATHQKLTVKRRADRSLLMVLNDQQKMVPLCNPKPHRDGLSHGLSQGLSRMVFQHGLSHGLEPNPTPPSPTSTNFQTHGFPSLAIRAIGVAPNGG